MQVQANIPAYIGKTTASLMLENIPVGEPYSTIYFSNNTTARNYVSKLRKEINSRKLLATLNKE